MSGKATDQEKQPIKTLAQLVVDSMRIRPKSKAGMLTGNGKGIK